MKQITALIVLIIGIWPLAALSATMAELEAQLQSLENQINSLSMQGDNGHDQSNQGMTVAGYTDAAYSVDSRDTIMPGFDLHHLSLFFKQNISDNWRFFSEIEYEDAPKFGAGEQITVLDCGADKICGGSNAADDAFTTINTLANAEGKIFTEAFNLNFTWKPYANLRIGRFFTPAGIWSIDHYPPFVTTQLRPRHIRNIFPQTVDGLLMYGIAPVADHFVSYDLYISNGEGNTSHANSNSNAAAGLRLNIDLPYLDNTNIGASLYHDVLEGSRDKTAAGLHTKLRQGNYEFQAEYATALLKPALGGNYHSRGYYLQGLYRFSNWHTGLRYDYYNYETRLAVDEITRTLFANYHISENLTLKLEHHLIDFESPSAEDYHKTTISISANLGN